MVISPLSTVSTACQILFCSSRPMTTAVCVEERALGRHLPLVSYARHCGERTDRRTQEPSSSCTSSFAAAAAR